MEQQGIPISIVVLFAAVIVAAILMVGAIVGVVLLA
jgi:hypothetical protein